MFSSNGAAVPASMDELVSATERAHTTDSVARVLSRRAGRIAFGVVLIAGMVSIAYEVIRGQSVWSTFGGPFSADSDRPRLDAALTLAVTWGAATAAYAIVRLTVWAWAPAPRGDALLRASLVVPAIGLALVLPLSLHAVYFALNGGNFESWVRLSVAVVGFAHVVFALTFGLRAAQLARTTAPTMTIGSVFLWSVCASVIPWGLLFIPELLTLITGLFILPVLFGFDALARRDRDALPSLPRVALARRWS